MSGVATHIKNLTGFYGDARLFRLDPPLRDDYREAEYEYVVVSAVVAPYSGPETYIFGADYKGEVVNWGELPGSFRGGLDHDAALSGADYEVTP